MNGEMHKVKRNISEFRRRLKVACVVSTTQIQGKRQKNKDGGDDTFSSMFCLMLCSV